MGKLGTEANYHQKHYFTHISGVAHNYRFLKDFRNLMRRMNCTRRCKTHGDNIVSLDYYMV